MRPKLFGIGLNRTGTTSLGQACRILGFAHAGFNPAMMQAYESRNIPDILSFAETYESFADWPWPLVYPVLHQRFPGARFILTVRETALIWFQSLCRHADRTGPTPYREIAYGHAMPHRYKDRHLAVYEGHNSAVREYFRNYPGTMVELCWEQGDGWVALCGFLGLPVPDAPFPHLNRSQGPSHARTSKP